MRSMVLKRMLASPSVALSHEEREALAHAIRLVEEEERRAMADDDTQRLGQR